jgi:hypothetical protein
MACAALQAVRKKGDHRVLLSNLLRERHLRKKIMTKNSGLPQHLYKRKLTLFAVLVILITTLGYPAAAETKMGPASDHLGLFITGLSGNDSFRDYFEKASQELRDVLLENGYAARDMVRFVEEPDSHKSWNRQEKSTRENLLKQLGELAKRNSPYENVFIFISGHANGRDAEAVFHVPGDDIVYQELMDAIEQIPAKHMTLVVAASQGESWIQKFSGPGRVIVAGNGLREFDSLPMIFLRTFPSMFSKASVKAEDKEATASISLRDIFAATQRTVLFWYQNNGLHLTETALIDADGDKKGETFLLPNAPDPNEVTAIETQPGLEQAAPTVEELFPMDFNLHDAQMADAITFQIPSGEKMS